MTGSGKGAWLVQFEGSEFGPLTQQELQSLLGQGKLSGRVFVWREGLDAWTQVNHLEDLKKLIEASNAPGSSSAARPDSTTQLQSDKPVIRPADRGQSVENRRSGKRFAILATVGVFKPGTSAPVVTGVCGDISIGGLLCLSGTSTPLDPQPLYTLRIRSNAPDFPAPVELTAKVAWMREDQAIGFQFTPKPEGDALTLLDGLLKKSREKAK